MEKKDKSLSRLFEFAGRFKYLTMASWVLSGISALTALVPYVYIWKIIQEVLAAAPNFERAEGLTHYGIMAVIFAVASILIYICGLLCSHLAAFRVQRNIRIRAMHHIVRLPMGFMDSIGSGKIRKIVDESSAATETYLAHQQPDQVGAWITPLGLIVMLLFFDWRLGLLSLVPTVIAFGVMSAMTGKKMEQRMREYQDSLANMSNEAVEYVRGIPVVKIFGQSVFSFKRFKEAIDNYQKWVIDYTIALRRPMMIYTTAINAVFAVLIAAAMYFTADGCTSVFLLNLIFYIIITPIITVTLNKIMYSSENKMVVSDALNRIDSVFEMQPIADAKNPKEPKDNSVEIENVRFKYDGTEKYAVDNVSISIQPGKHIALVGASGGGKTTIASLVARFWDVTDGIIKIGGVDVRDIKKEMLMDMVSFVFQDSKLLKTSIYENIRMAKPDASCAEILQALHDAQCDDILEKLPNGADSVIGAKGVYLSGGEMQRLSIARAMLKNSPILILDEATAFADPDNEARVWDAFEKLSKGKTVLMIAHRLSTVVNTDCIYVMEEGRIAEKGTHKELLSKNGKYAEMWKEYTGTANWKVGKNND